MLAMATSRSALPSKVFCSWIVVVSMMGASPETSTVSVLAPGSNLTLAVLVPFSRTSNGDRRGAKSARLDGDLVGSRVSRLSKRYPPVLVGLAVCHHAGGNVYDAEVGIDHGGARRVH